MKIDFRVYLITDRKLCPGGDLLGTVEKALDGGVRAVQLREKDLPGRELFRLAERMRKMTAECGARLLINDRADVARAVGADGVHLGVLSIPPREARGLLGADAIIGCSAHNEEELRQAGEGGADFVTFGPVYPTPSKSRFGPPVGIPALAAACRTARVPVFALGGIGPGNLEEVARTGCSGVALISGIVASPDPRAAAAAITGYFAQGPRRAEMEREGAS
jgi:thiamine-phosphate pyrophosphorylase